MWEFKVKYGNDSEQMYSLTVISFFNFHFLSFFTLVTFTTLRSPLKAVPHFSESCLFYMKKPYFLPLAAAFWVILFFRSG
jgi:hypothetical protein